MATCVDAPEQDVDASSMTASEGGSYGIEGYGPPVLNGIVSIKEDESALGESNIQPW